jgi:hypothetical protein
LLVVGERDEGYGQIAESLGDLKTFAFWEISANLKIPKEEELIVYSSLSEWDRKEKKWKVSKWWGNTKM